MEGEGCVNQVGVYDEPRASLAMGCYLGTPRMDTCGGKMVYEVDLGVNL
jgi:hypothetical protein